MIEHAYWLDTAPMTGIGASTAALDGQYDVAIVGGGYTGLSAARVLARSGARTIVLERDDIGAGASSRNAGQVLTGLKMDPAALVARFGKARARAMFDASTAAINRLEALVKEEQIACGFARCGHLQAAAKASHFGALREERDLLARVFGHRVELVAPADQARELGSRRYHGLSIDEASACLNPAQYAAGLAGAAIRSGADVRAHTEVTRLSRQPPGWRVATSRGECQASHVLIATNAYVTRLTPALQRRFMPVGSYIVVTAPLDAETAARVLPRGRVAFDSKHFLYYFRLTDDRRLLFGGRAAFGTPTAASTRKAAEILRRAIVEVFPYLAGVAVEYTWSGKVAFTRDLMPHAGRVGDLWFAGGYGGHGVAMATRFGELIGARIGGGQVSDPLFDLPCPTIPFLRDRPWFLPIVGAVYRVKDLLS